MAEQIDQTYQISIIQRLKLSLLLLLRNGLFFTILSAIRIARINRMNKDVKILFEKTLKAYHNWFLATFLRHLKHYKEAIKILKKKVDTDPHYFDGINTESQMRKFLLDRINAHIKGENLEKGKYEDRIIALRPYLVDFARFKYCGQDQVKAEDLAQDTILKALRFQDKFDESKAKLATWCTTIMHNTSIDQWRKQKTRVQGVVRIHNGFEAGGWGEEYNKYLDSREPTADEHMDAELIANALKNLTGIGSDMLRMRAAGYTYDEIAEKLNKPLGTIKGNIHRARGKLMEQLKELQVA